MRFELARRRKHRLVAVTEAVPGDCGTIAVGPLFTSGLIYVAQPAVRDAEPTIPIDALLKTQLPGARRPDVAV